MLLRRGRVEIDENATLARPNTNHTFPRSSHDIPRFIWHWQSPLGFATSCSWHCYRRGGSRQPVAPTKTTQTRACAPECLFVMISDKTDKKTQQHYADAILQKQTRIDPTLEIGTELTLPRVCAPADPAN